MLVPYVIQPGIFMYIYDYMILIQLLYIDVYIILIKSPFNSMKIECPNVIPIKLKKYFKLI